MNTLAIYSALIAGDAEAPVAITDYRHVHVAPKPFVVVAYHLAAELAAPIGFLYGTNRARPQVTVVGEPRDRPLRITRTATFATALNKYVDTYRSIEVSFRVNRRRERIREATVSDAPQLIVPNQATSHWITGILGRSLRNLRTTGERAVDPALPAAGRHLSFLKGRADLSSSGLVLAATDALRMHWAFPQLTPEGESLPTLLGWLEPPGNLTPLEAARAGEHELPYGPVPDPAWDDDELEPAIEAYHNAVRRGRAATKAEAPLRAAVESALLPAWQGTWNAIDLLRALPGAAHVTERWADDRRAWAGHVERMTGGTAFFRNRATALGAARVLRRAETADPELERQMALDDPKVMAAHIASGEAFDGEVVHVDLANTEQPGRRRVPRPLITVRTFEPFDAPFGTVLHWSARPELAATVDDIAGDVVRLKVHAGMGRALRVPPHLLPAVGDSVVFSPFGTREWWPDTLPGAIPWTHQIPAAV